MAQLTMLTIICWLLHIVNGHSNVERVNVANNYLVDLDRSGYSRGNVLRTPNYTDAAMTYQLPPDGRDPSGILAEDPICKDSQRFQWQSPGSPRLNVRSSDVVVLQYNENGHITQPYNNAVGKNGTGQIFVYGTFRSTPDDRFLSIHGQWTTDGQGGDRQGSLLYQGPFDDGECYQVSNSSIARARMAAYPAPGLTDPAQNQERWCKNYVQLPSFNQSTLYSLYWVWSWPFVETALTGAREDYYTTCIDLQVVM